MTHRTEHITEKRGLRVMSSWVDSPEGREHIKTLEARYLKDMCAVHNQLVYEGKLEELEYLHLRHGKPEKIKKYESSTKSVPISIVMDLQNAADSFEALSDLAMQESLKLKLIIKSLKGGE